MTHDGDSGARGAAERRTQIWIALISAVTAFAVAGIGLYGTLRATDSTIVTGPAPAGPTTTVTVTERASAPSTDEPEDDPPGDLPPADEVAQEVDWATNAEVYGSDFRKTVKYECPENGLPQDIWGDVLYTGESSVCTAAVHDGRITTAEGGSVVIEIREGSENYPATRRNDITSKEVSSWDLSFAFLPPR